MAEKKEDNRESYNQLKINFPSSVKTGNQHVDEVSAVYNPVKGSDSALIVLHGFTMNKDGFLSVGDVLNQFGISSYHMDLPYHGERGIKGVGYESFDFSPEDIRRGLEQTVSDISQSIDYLELLGNKNIGIAGYSLGGIVTLLSMGLDERLQQGLAFYAGGDIADLIMNSPISQEIADGLRKRGVTYEDLSETLEEVEPCKYARNIGSDRLYMQNGKSDNIVPPKNTEKFISNLKRKQIVEWVNSDHFMPRSSRHVFKRLKRLTKQ
jgi:dienelactone hydrolase